MGIKKYIKNTNISKRYIQVSIIIFLIIIIGLVGTYAWFTWSSTNNTSVTLSIGELADVTYTTGPDIKVENLSPVYNYTDGESTTFKIRNKDTTTSLVYKIKLDITTIDTELQTDSLKYILLKDNKKVSEGNFKDITSGSSIILYENVLSSNTNSNYILYIYIDGNMENNTNMMNKSLVGKLDVVASKGAYTMANYITNLYTNASKTPVKNNEIDYNYAPDESLMNDRLGGTTTDLDGGNIRYYGANPNNYIYFNCSDYNNQNDTTCEKWRIIGVFNGKVKIIRNKPIGEYSWDSSASGVNSGNGENEWPEADAMKLLNPGYESESIGGSLYYNSKSGTCYNGKTNATTSCDFTSSGIKNDETRNKIAEVTWNLGGYNSFSEYSNQIYGYERGTKVVYSERSTTWKGKVALPYPSDYGYATDFNKCSQNLYDYDSDTSSYACRTNDWMYPIITNSGVNYGWLLTPNSDFSIYVWFVRSSGSVYDNYNYIFSARGVAPTLYLNAGEYLGGGDGSSASPYQLRSPSYVTLTNLGLSVDTSHTPDFTTVSGNSGVKYVNSSQTATGLGDGTNGVYAAEDDLGNSYYFRGNVDNNYVYFAKNWWRIIRINGDGTIRMIYTGNPNDSISQEYISESAYNSSYNDNAYVGYMYGSAGSSTYEATHANTNDSTIKRVIDTWYQNNLSSYSTYIVDAIYCNDREVVNVTYTYNNGTNTTTYNGNGTGTNKSAYASLKRNHIDHNPTLKCSNNNDKFTVSNTLGNGALTNPIGLPTTDEIVMSGANAYDNATSSYIINHSCYLCAKGGNWYWTMTPNRFTGGFPGGTAYVDSVYSGGYVSDGIVNDDDFAVLPVVSLKSNAITGGAGTVSNPFYVNEEYSAS